MRIARILIMLAAAGVIGGADEPRAARELGRARSDGLVEASGIAASARDANIFWTHNDGGEGVLYALRQDGSAAGRVEVAAKFRDLEDIAADDAGNLYLADMGNNDRNRKRVIVYRIIEPDPASTKPAEVLENWKIVFPDEPFDCESLFIWQKHGYVISKLEEGERASVYRFALTPTRKTRVLEKICKLPIDHPVTAADISRDGKQLAVLTRGALHIFQIGGKLENVADAPAEEFSLPPVQAEGCCFTQGGVLVIAETGEMFLAPTNPPATTQSAR